MDRISPNFAIEAKYLSSNSKHDEAVELCKKGMALYPDYIAGYKVYISALLKQKKHDEASAVFSSALKKFPFNSNLLELKFKLQNFNNSIGEFEESSILENDLISAQRSALSLSQIEDLMSEFSDKPSYENTESNKSSDIIASILVEQEQYEEAIKAYEDLSRNNPERSSYYQEIINSLKEKL